MFKWLIGGELGKPPELYDEFKWGDPAPTTKQYGYARSLGVQLKHGMSRSDVSDAIDYALNDQKPATKSQLREITKMHGILPREVSAAEANDVIEFLSGHTYRCPHCREDVCCADDTSCSLCRKSLREVKIPIVLPKRPKK